MTRDRNRNWRPGRSASDPARKVALDVLLAVDLDEAYANLELPKQIKKAHLGRQDAAYATNLTYETLRMLGRWDAVLEHCVEGRTLSELDPPVRALLRLGTQQLLGFGTPPHAAINETVMLARNEVGTGASGLINAVLRRVSERTLTEWQEQLQQDAGGKVTSVAFLATWYSHPEWIVRALAQSLKTNGRPVKDLLAVLRADNTPAQVALVARDISPEELAADIERGHMSSKPGVLVDSAVVLEGGDPGRVWAVQDAKAAVQDEGSQLIARTLAEVELDGEKDELWLDMCAGPGGKTATLAAVAPTGVNIRANEPHEHRLDLVAESVRRFSRRVQLRLGDGRDIGELEPNTYDRVLIDAPCTGIGALRRRPEARWRKAAGDALDLSVLQAELLESGWAAVRPGGVVAYSTCSPYLMETHEITAAFRERHPEAIVLDAPAIASAVAKMPLAGVDNHLQLWPDLHESDAMYLVLFKKPLADE